jgi:hypothetical protein
MVCFGLFIGLIPLLGIALRMGVVETKREARRLTGACAALRLFDRIETDALSAVEVQIPADNRLELKGPDGSTVTFTFAKNRILRKREGISQLYARWVASCVFSWEEKGLVRIRFTPDPPDARRAVPAIYETTVRVGGGHE